MKMDLDKIIQLAIERASAECGHPVVLADSVFPNQTPGADLDGWALFVTRPERGEFDSILVGVNTETGETRIFDPDDL